MATRYKKIWASKEEYDAHDVRVARTLRRLRELAEKAQAELDAKQQAS
jgi:hypothetical protein